MLVEIICNTDPGRFAQLKPGEFVESRDPDWPRTLDYAVGEWLDLPVKEARDLIDKGYAISLEPKKK